MSSFIKAICDNEEILEKIVKRAFLFVDVNDDKGIDERELEKILAQISIDMGAESPTKEDVDEVMKYLDKDISGEIDITEFKVLIKDILKSLIE